MDPNACLDMIVDAIESNDWEEAYYSMVDLRAWLRAGGFPPKDSKKLEYAKRRLARG